MKFSFFLAILFLLWVFPAAAQMAGVLKPGDAVIIEMQSPPGVASAPRATYVISEQGNLKLPMLKQEIPAAGISLKTLTSRINEAGRGSGIHPVPSVKTILFGCFCGCITVPIMDVGGEVSLQASFPCVRE